MTIILDNITVSYDGAPVLKDFFISIEDMRIYQIVGPKESGKSTVLKVFLGEIKPDAGRVARMGDYKYPTLQSAYVPQESHFKEKKSALWHVKKAHRKVSGILVRSKRFVNGDIVFFIPQS